MVDTSLATAIQNHIDVCKNVVDEAMRTSSQETIRSSLKALEEAESMPHNPELFFEAQRAMYF